MFNLLCISVYQKTTDTVLVSPQVAIAKLMKKKRAFEDMSNSEDDLEGVKLLEDDVSDAVVEAVKPLEQLSLSGSQRDGVHPSISIYLNK
jgi:hypothetical protein